MKNKEQGFILLITLVWMITLSLLAVGVLAMSRSSLTNEKQWVNMDECYMYGQMALNSARVRIMEDSKDYFELNDNAYSAFKDWYDDELPKLKEKLRNASTLPGKDPLGKEWPTRWETGTYKAKIEDSKYASQRIDFLLQITVKLDEVQRSFEQHFTIKMGAAIFDYAYFINNNGWLHSSETNTFYINGNIGANANFSIDGGTVLNGTVFAAEREEADLLTPGGDRILGKVTDKEGVAGYNGYTSQSATEYEGWLDDHPNAMAREVLNSTGLTPEAIASSLLYNPDLIENGRMPATEESKPLKMPFLGELKGYADEAINSSKAGWSQLDYIDENGVQQSISGANGGVVEGDLIINGDFKIMGKIVVKGDLIIRGEFSGLGLESLGETAALREASGLSTGDLADKLATANGKGGFFVDRNINIIGDLKSSTGLSGKYDPFLSLAARGNIIMGDTRDVDMGLISNRNTDSTGQMLAYETDDPMYQNTSGTHFNGNYSLPEIGAKADEAGAVSLGTGNVYQQYSRTWINGPYSHKVKQPQKKQTRKKTKTKITLTYDSEGEVATKTEKIIYVRNQYRWINNGDPTTRATADEAVNVSYRRDYTTWVDVVPSEKREIDVKIYKQGKWEYNANLKQVIIATDPAMLQNPHALTSYKSLLWRKVEFWKKNKNNAPPKIKPQQPTIKIGTKVYGVANVNSHNSKWNRWYTEDGDKIRGYTVSLSEEIEKEVTGESATVDRSYFENKMPITDYWKLKPKAPKRIDAVLYTNHLIAGSMERNATINGSLVARDEALKIKKGNKKSQVSFNWDVRLGENAYTENDYLKSTMQELMPATIGGSTTAGEDGVIFTREVNIAMVNFNSLERATEAMATATAAKTAAETAKTEAEAAAVTAETAEAVAVAVVAAGEETAAAAKAAAEAAEAAKKAAETAAIAAEAAEVAKKAAEAAAAVVKAVAEAVAAEEAQKVAEMAAAAEAEAEAAKTAAEVAKTAAEKAADSAAGAEEAAKKAAEVVHKGAISQ